MNQSRDATVRQRLRGYREERDGEEMYLRPVMMKLFLEECKSCLVMK
jgi:hypothetical protein